MLPEILIGISVLILVYTFFGYPLLVQLLGVLRPLKQNRSPWTPYISIVITARNEAKNIEAKLENTLQLDYPSDAVEIIVSSDASDDDTEKIANSFADKGVKVIRLDERSGKTAAQNAAVKEASGEVIVFSDATTFYQPDVLKQLLELFDADGRVGCVCGHLTYKKNAGERYEEDRFYWSWEVNLRIGESRLGFIPGVAGCIYAVRKNAFVFLESYAISDFLQPLAIGHQGHHVVYQPKAVAIEMRSKDLIEDFKRRRRTISRALNGLCKNLKFINPFTNRFRAVQILSHKVLRWFSPYFLLLIVIAAQFSGEPLLGPIFLIGLLISIVSGLAGVLLKDKNSGRLLRIPAYFLLLNLASIFAVGDWIRGKHYVTWEPQR